MTGLRCWFLLVIFSNTLSSTTVADTNPLTNVALYKPAYQSSTYSIGDASLGNDGNSTDMFLQGHCMHTLRENNSWWMVDLKGQMAVHILVLTNRGRFSTRLSNFQINVFETDPRVLVGFPVVSGQVCYSQTTPLGNGTYTWRWPQPIVGRYVRLIMFELEHLHICELEVFISSEYKAESFYGVQTNKMLSAVPMATVFVDDRTG